MFYGAPSWTADVSVPSEVALIEHQAVARDVGKSNLLCPGEALGDQSSLAFCSGVLVAPDIVLTAKHCVHRRPCESWFATTAFDGDAAQLPADQEASCQGILDSFEDVAAVRLQASLAAPPTKINLRAVSKDTRVVVAAHPFGTFTKIDNDGRVSPDPIRAGLFRVGADLFQGSSGGGIFDGQGGLLAILSAGPPDGEYDETGRCMRLGHDKSLRSLAWSPLPLLTRLCAVSLAPFCPMVVAATPTSPATGQPADTGRRGWHWSALLLTAGGVAALLGRRLRIGGRRSSRS